MGWFEDNLEYDVCDEEDQGTTARMTKDKWQLLWEGEKMFRRCAKATYGVDTHQAQQEPNDPRTAVCVPLILRDRQEDAMGREI